MSVDNLWNNDYYAGYDGYGSGMKRNEKKSEISQNPLRHLDSELREIRYTRTWKKNSADDSKAIRSPVENCAM